MLDIFVWRFASIAKDNIPPEFVEEDPEPKRELLIEDNAKKEALDAKNMNTMPPEVLHLAPLQCILKFCAADSEKITLKAFFEYKTPPCTLHTQR